MAASSRASGPAIKQGAKTIANARADILVVDSKGRRSCRRPTTISSFPYCSSFKVALMRCLILLESISHMS